MSRLGWLAALVAVACASASGPPPRPSPETSISRPPAPSAGTALPAPEPREPGTREQVEALRQADVLADPSARFVTKKAILSAIRQLADPRGADALYEYANAPAKPAVNAGERHHFRNQIGVALAEIGDVRAMPLLAECLERDPLQIYDDSDEQGLLKRDDNERVVAARCMADLAELHPERVAEHRPGAAKALSSWLADRPSPHANVLRARARLRIQDKPVLDQLVAWADPKTPLPKAGAQPPFPEAFMVAQVALRYLGASGDPRARGILEKQLQRRPKAFDATMDALMMGGGAILGMTLRALGVGAAQGLAELGDSRAVPALLAYVDGAKENEQSRIEACSSLGWLATDAHAAEIDKRLKSVPSNPTPEDQFRLACMLESMTRRRLAGVTATLVSLLGKPTPASMRPNVGVALGRSGLDAATESLVLDRLSDPEARVGAAIALLLGGSAGAVERAAATVGSFGDDDLDRVQNTHRAATANVFDADVEGGSLFRWIDNAERASTVQRKDEPLPFAQELQRSLRDVQFELGPHSLSRTLLRGRLFALARAGGSTGKRAAHALDVLGERGVLMALAERR